MRSGPVVGGLLPRSDPALCAAIIAEADFFGVEALLQHVKARAWRHKSGEAALSDGEAAAG